MLMAKVRTDLDAETKQKVESLANGINMSRMEAIEHMVRYSIEEDAEGFASWISQKTRDTVQDALEVDEDEPQEDKNNEHQEYDEQPQNDFQMDEPPFPDEQYPNTSEQQGTTTEDKIDWSEEEIDSMEDEIDSLGESS